MWVSFGNVNYVFLNTTILDLDHCGSQSETFLHCSWFIRIYIVFVDASEQWSSCFCAIFTDIITYSIVYVKQFIHIRFGLQLAA